MEHIQDLIQAGKIEEAIQETETKLSQLPQTDFHKIIGKDLLHLQPSLATFLNHFYEDMTENEELDIKAIYIEMNSFTTQYQRWFFQLLAYDSLHSRDNLDWLTDFSGESEKTMTVTGYEALQEANQKYMESEGYRDDNLRTACELQEYLVILRAQELVKHTLAANKGKAPWASVTLFTSAHDYEDLMYIAK
ncbi:hypothetical protein [Chitinophaga barathri]|uniref:Uncharacterized protein n=1 Tax=Chitinophaga barathri TaxID=1647451 RepID=A0A3N4MD43_9BACT|nr:hypothetical protein [Chitinophaga barathri]RPD39846.1 hypothetical protein EG028_17100 [Chitinophaga barathri]